MDEVVQIFSDVELVTGIIFFTVVHDIIYQNCNDSGDSSVAECRTHDQNVVG